MIIKKLSSKQIDTAYGEKTRFAFQDETGRWLSTFNDLRGYKEGDKIEGEVTTKEVGDKVFYNFKLIKPTDSNPVGSEILTVVKRIEEKIDALKEQNIYKMINTKLPDDKDSTRDADPNEMPPVEESPF